MAVNYTDNVKDPDTTDRVPANVNNIVSDLCSRDRIYITFYSNVDFDIASDPILWSTRKALNTVSDLGASVSVSENLWRRALNLEGTTSRKVSDATV